MNLPPVIPSQAGPVAPVERIEVLDIIRGLALFGILVVNMLFFGWPIYLIIGDLLEWETATDWMAHRLIRFFFEGKFYTMFSFLFGLGMAIQMERAELRGARFRPLFLRRLGILFAIGTLHAYLIWEGDILMLYALAGLGLLLFRNTRPTRLLVGAVILLLAPIAIYAAAWIALLLIALLPGGAEQVRLLNEEWIDDCRVMALQAFYAYGEGTYREILAQRATDRTMLYYGYIHFVPAVLGMFLLGLYAGRLRLFHSLAGQRPVFRRVLAAGFWTGFVANLTYVVAGEYSSWAEYTFLGLVSFAGFSVGGPAFCFFYIAGIVLLVQHRVWQKLFRPLGCVGRMALSNYIFQSLVCTTIFYSYGLGWYGKVGPAAGFGLALAIFLLQIPLSVQWLRCFRFGPLEWLWRSLTYGKPQPMRIALSSSDPEFPEKQD